ncbi:MAG: hypothetical protein ACP5N2_02970 [Candidatus Nanoarchaeia archaeon]
MDYVLLENTQQKESGAVLAVPAELFNTDAVIGKLVKLEDSLGNIDRCVIRGRINDVTKQEFSTDSYFHSNSAYLIPLVDLKNIPNRENIGKELANLADKYGVDRTTSSFTFVREDLLNQVIFSGDIYAVRTSKKGAPRTSFAFVDKGKIVSLENKVLVYDGEIVPSFDEGNVGFLMQDNDASVAYVGEGEFTRKTLSKFHSIGSMGGGHVNTRSIVPLNKTDVKKITYLND